MGREDFESHTFGANAVLVDQIKSKAGELIDLYRALRLEGQNFPRADRALFIAESSLETSVAWALKAAARGVIPKKRGVSNV
jgi:DNA-binding NarL/FixJ family response regulator